MLFYVTSFQKAGETTRLGTLFAAEALREAKYLKREGWKTSLIKKGPDVISRTDLERDAGRERALELL